MVTGFASSCPKLQQTYNHLDVVRKYFSAFLTPSTLLIRALPRLLEARFVFFFFVYVIVSCVVRLFVRLFVLSVGRVRVCSSVMCVSILLTIFGPRVLQAQHFSLHRSPGWLIF